MEREYGSLIRGALAAARKNKNAERNSSGARYGLFASLIDGMETLPKTLAASLPKGAIRRQTAVRRIMRNESGGWRVELLDGPPIDAAGVILATEAHASARMVDSLDPELAVQLRSIPYASSAIAQVCFRRDQVGHPLDGFGAVIPIIENRKILAISFTSVKLAGRAPTGSVLMRVFVGGATQPELFDLDDASIESIVLDEVGQLLGIKGSPQLIQIARHARAMPQYTLGHQDRVSKIQELAAKHSDLILAGNAFDGVGIPDVVRAAQEAAERLIKSLAGPAAISAA
jgi:oxygen-dependent protoporphyrinogen oxidase